MDIETGERAEQHIDAFIEKRDRERRRDEGERRAVEAWRESERQYEAKRRAERLFEWVEYHEGAAERALASGEAIAARHRAQIEVLLGPGRNGENGNGRHKGEEH